MIEETVLKIRQAVRKAGQMDPKHKAELIVLLERLEAEIRALPPAQAEKAHSVAQFAETAINEAARRDKSAKLLMLSRGALKESVSDFEISHPKLTAVVDGICTLLATIGV